MTVEQATEKPLQVTCVQWVGNNQAEVDGVIDSPSTRRGDALINDSLEGSHLVALNSWIVDAGGQAARAFSDREFNFRFAVI